jgi:two-component system, chemotaxis family, chemotaxis protein CheY
MPYCRQAHGHQMLDKSQPVLIVDDSRTMCAIISKIANQSGFKDVDAVYTGLDALAQLRKRTYGLIIVDWEMSPMSGLDLIMRIRSDRSLPTAAIVLTTANHQWVADMLKSRTTSGADIHILKPFSAETLSKKLAETFPESEIVKI